MPETVHHVLPAGTAPTVLLLVAVSIDRGTELDYLRVPDRPCEPLQHLDRRVWVAHDRCSNLLVHQDLWWLVEAVADHYEPWH